MHPHGDLIVPLILEHFTYVSIGGFIVEEKTAEKRCVPSPINTNSCKKSLSTEERS